MPTIPLSSTDSSPPDAVNIQTTPTTFEFIIIETMAVKDEKMKCSHESISIKSVEEEGDDTA